MEHSVFRYLLRPARLLREWGEKWDSICHRCGICCYERELSRSGELVVKLSSPCKHLDTQTNLCRIYPRRFRLCRECRRVTIFHALFSRYMPPSCGYVRKFRFSRKGGLSASPRDAFPEEPGDKTT